MIYYFPNINFLKQIIEKEKKREVWKQLEIGTEK